MPETPTAEPLEVIKKRERKAKTRKWEKLLAERERRFADGEPLWDFERK